MVEPNINATETALTTGVVPSRTRWNISTVSGESDPTNIRVVLKFSKDIKKPTIAALINVGRKKGRVTALNAFRGVAPKLSAASSKLGSNRL